MAILKIAIEAKGAWQAIPLDRMRFRKRKASERAAARRAPFGHTDCRAETQIPPKPRFTQVVKASHAQTPANKG